MADSVQQDPGTRTLQGLFNVSYGKTGNRPRWKMRLWLRDVTLGRADVVLSRDDVRAVLAEIAVKDPALLDEVVQAARARQEVQA